MDFSWKSIINPAFSDSVKDALKARYDLLMDDTNGSARDGGISFPSLEGALLSLAFLTFAVFLIDLIQTLLSRLRGGTNYYVKGAGRRKRSSFLDSGRSSVSKNDVDTIFKITSSIDEGSGFLSYKKT